MNRNSAIACAVVLFLAVSAAPVAADPGRGATILCYVWANNASPAINVAYTPSNVYSYNAVGRAPANTVKKTATGTYSVTCKGVGGGALFASTAPEEASAEPASEGVSTGRVANETGEGVVNQASGTWGPGGHVQVTAYGAEDADYCKVVSWVTGGADFTVTVKCFNANGAASDSRFDMLFVW